MYKPFDILITTVGWFNSSIKQNNTPRAKHRTFVSCRTKYTRPGPVYMSAHSIEVTQFDKRIIFTQFEILD